MVFQKGQSGNPKGRPKGSRDDYVVLREAIINAVAQLGKQYRESKHLSTKDRAACIQSFIQAVIAEATAKDAGALLKTLTSLLPKQLQLESGEQPLVLKLVKLNGDGTDSPITPKAS